MAAKVFAGIGAACTMLALIFAIVAGATGGWYRISLAVGTASSQIDVGLLNMCTTQTLGTVTQKSCVKTTDDGTFTDQTACMTPQRTGKSMKMRFQATLALVVVGSVAVLLAFVVILLAGCAHNEKARHIGTPLLLMALLMYCAALALFVWSVERWYFCGHTYCEMVGGFGGCTNKFTYSFALLATAIPLIVVAMVMHCLVMKATAPPPTASGGDPHARGNHAVATTHGNHSPHGHHHDGGSKQRGGGRAPVPDGYYYDSGSGLWWSDADEMYWEGPDTDQYYSPAYDQWYDPASNQWYAKDASGNAWWV